MRGALLILRGAQVCPSLLLERTLTLPPSIGEYTKDTLGMECTQIILAVSEGVAPKILLEVYL